MLGQRRICIRRLPLLFLSGLLKVVLLFQTSVVVPNVSRLSSCSYVYTFLCAREETYTSDRPEVAGSAQRKWQRRHGYTCRTKPSLSQKNIIRRTEDFLFLFSFVHLAISVGQGMVNNRKHIHMRTHTDTRTSVHLFWTQEILNKITSAKSLILKHPALYLSLLVSANV